MYKENGSYSLTSYSEVLQSSIRFKKINNYVNSQKYSIGFYPEPYKSNSYSHTLLSKVLLTLLYFFFVS